MGHENGEKESQDEEDDAEPGGAFLKDVRGLGAEHLIGHAGTKSRSQTFLAGALHEHDEDEEETDKRLQHHEKSD